MVAEFAQTILPIVLPWVKFFMYFFILVIITVVGVFIIINAKRRKWTVEVHEQRADGKIHTTGFDTLIERKLNMGTKTIYWLKKGKCEVIPPPDETVDRWKGKDEVDYLRVERDYVPTTKHVNVDYSDPTTRKILTRVNDKILINVRSVKTTLFNSEPVRQKYLYIPINKTLTANMTFKPINYDMNMMAQNQISNADAFFASKYEFWKKYGAVIVFAATIIFLIILAYLTYDYISKIIEVSMAKVGSVADNLGTTNNLLNNLMGNSGSPPPG